MSFLNYGIFRYFSNFSILSWLLWGGLLYGCTPKKSEESKNFRKLRIENPSRAIVENDLSPMLRERRQDALARERLEKQGGARDAINIALEEALSGWPIATHESPGGEAALAVDGDLGTAWRGSSASLSYWDLRFARIVHLGLLRFFWGDASNQGVPSSYRVEIQRPDREQHCSKDAPWELLPGGLREDRDPNTFVHGPQDVHAMHQALFTDEDACALRLRIVAMAEGQSPVLREVKILEGAPSLAREAKIHAEGTWRQGAPFSVTPEAIVDGTYEHFWAGEPGRGKWQITLRLPSPRWVDRIWLALGYDGVTEEIHDRSGRRYAGAYLPLNYTISTAYDNNLEHLIPLHEGDAPHNQGRPLPVRRRLIKFLTPRPVQLLQLTITEATGLWGEHKKSLQAPVVRELRLYDSADRRPVITEPLFLSVNANPSELTAALQGGEANSDGSFARTIYHRLRRVLLGFDADTRWPADASRRRNEGTGRFLEVIEGDDPTFSSPLLNAIAPPPILFLSGSFDWDFDTKTRKWKGKRKHWSWDVDAPAGSLDRGMGQLRRVVQKRSTPMVGFCGGAQILALLESIPAHPEHDLDEQIHLDRVLLRNGNQKIRGVSHQKDPLEVAWWYDKPERDRQRPEVFFQPSDPLLSGISMMGRSSSRELPLSHGDMIRGSAFSGPLRRFLLTGWSHFCRSWVDPSGPEPTWPDPHDSSRRCVLVPQMFRSRSMDGYPIIGFQFHPEQRDLQRFAPNSPQEARGDALNFIANSLSLILDAYERLFWPHA